MAEYVADKLDAARHSITGSNVSKAICKASSREIMGPKRKHIDYLVTCSESDYVSVPNLAEMMFERSRMSSWVIVSKSLVTFHHLMSNGNERFLQYLASRTALWNLDNFLDKSGVLGYDMSTFIRRYSAYLIKKVHTYTEAGHDFCRVNRGPKGLIRKFDTTKLLKALPQVQQQVDSLIEVDVQSNELGNGVINSAFVMLFKDLVKLFACYNDGMINLLEKYFEMNKKNCKEALDIYRKFISRMDTVKEFLKVAEDVGINPSDIPDLTKAPSSLIEALENHYQTLEKGKVPVASAKRPNLEPITVPPLTTESLNNPVKFAGEEYKKQALIKEEDERLKTFKQIRVHHETLLQAAPSRPHPSTRQDAWKTTFETNAVNNPPPSQTTTTNNNDLLALHDVFAAPKPAPSFSPNVNFGQPASFPPTSGTSPVYQVPDSSGGFASNQPSPWSPGAPQSGLNNGENLFASDVSFQQTFGADRAASSSGILQPMNRQQQVVNQTETEADKGDLDSSLVKVAMSIDNLNVSGIRPPAGTSGKGHQWTPPKPTVKTGGAHFQMGSGLGATLSPAGMAQPAQVPAYTQPQMFATQPLAYGQPTMVQQPSMPTNMFAQQGAPTSDPFGAPVQGNHALF